MANTTSLNAALVEMQKKCIGLYFNPYIKKYVPVIEETEYSFVVIYIGNLLALSEEHLPKDDEHNPRVVIHFPENKTLFQMMENPIEFNKWCVENLE